MNYVWICKNGKSAKLWGYTSFVNNTTDAWSIQYYYGSIGRPMQNLNVTEKIYPNQWAAQDDITEKIEDKERKGYEKISAYRYWELTECYLNMLQEEIDGPEENLPLKMKEAWHLKHLHE
jgi:hypothetical protein